MIRTHDLTPSLVALFGAAGMGALALFMTLAPSSLAMPADADEPSSSPIAIEKPPPLSLAPFTSYAGIAERPLFNARRAKDFVPPPQPSTPPKPQLPPLSDYRLVGLVVSPETQRALVARASGDIVRLKPGDTLDGRTVTKIGARGVSLTGDGREDVLAFPHAQTAHSGHGLALAGRSAQANR